MNLEQTPQPTERVGLGKRISDLWNSRNRIARLTILVTSGLILNCCCIIIPLSTKANGLAAQPNASVNTISTPALTTAQEPLVPPAAAISPNTESDHNGEGRVACKNFTSLAAAEEADGTADIPLDGSDKAGRACQSLP
jgi:hypothetical protein